MERGGEPRILFPRETVKTLYCINYIIYFQYYQDRSPSRDGSPEADDFRQICSCKSTCQRRTCPCKEAGLHCGDNCRCGTKRNRCKNQVNNMHSCNVTWIVLHSVSHWLRIFQGCLLLRCQQAREGAEKRSFW